jgi:hypothetical protein
MSQSHSFWASKKDDFRVKYISWFLIWGKNDL